MIKIINHHHNFHPSLSMFSIMIAITIVIKPEYVLNLNMCEALCKFAEGLLLMASFFFFISINSIIVVVMVVIIIILVVITDYLNIF